MDKFALLIDVYDKNENIDSFIYDLENIHPLVFPDKLPYQGIKLYISGSLENGFSFSPDGYEMWIRFSKEHIGKWLPYLIDRQYTFIFKIIEEPLHDMAMNNEIPGPTDKVDEFDRIKEFKKR